MVERIRYEIGAVNKTKQAFKGVRSGLDRMKKAVLSLKGAFVALFSVAAIQAGFRAVIGAALPFNRALAEVSTLLKGTKEEMDFVRDAAREMAGEFGGTGTAQAKAFYQAISKGAGTAEQAAVLLNVANKLAIGGIGSLVSAVDLLTTSLNNYASTGLTAAKAADILFIGVKVGATTIGELGAAIGRTASLAKEAGVSFEELVAATAALTKTGITTKEAITGVRAILAAIIKPTDQAAKAAVRMELVFNAEALAAKGLSQFLKDLIIATGGSLEKMGELFAGTEALLPVLSLTGDAAEALAEGLDLMGNSAGAMERAYKKVADELDFRFKAVLGKVGVALEKVGTSILTVFVPAMEVAVKAVDALVTTIIVLAATQVKRLIVVLASAATGLGIFSKAVGVARGALVLLGGPIGLVVGAVTLLIIKFDSLKAAMERMFPSMTKADSLWGRFFATMRDGNKVIRDFIGLSFEGELATKIVRLRALQDTLAIRAGDDPLAALKTIGAGSTKALNLEQDRLLARIRELGEMKMALDAAAAAAAKPPVIPVIPTPPAGASGTGPVEALEKISDGLVVVKEQAMEVASAFDQFVVGSVDRIGDAFVDMALGAKASFSDMVTSILRDFVRMEIRILTSKLFKGGSGGGGILGDLLFTAGRAVAGALGGSVAPTSAPIPVPRPLAHGGPVRGGAPIKVHAGEVFIPQQDGRILNASQANRMGGGGGGGATVVNIYAPPGSQVEETRSSDGGTEEINVFIDNATAQNINRPGSATFRALTAGHGTRQQLVNR